MPIFKNILYPVDPRELSATSLSRALEIAQDFGAALHFLYVHTWVPVPYPDEALMLGSPMGEGVPIVGPVLSEFVAELHKIYPKLADYSCFYSVENGILADAVGSYVQEHRIDLVLTEHRHHSGILHWFFRSGDEEILEKVEVPVLVLPA